MSTHIYVVSSEESPSVVSKLNSVFNVKSSSNTSSSSQDYFSVNKQIKCHLSNKEKMLIDYYLQNNLHIKFNELKSYLKTKVSAVDNVILSSYLRAQGYTPARIMGENGSSTRLWIK